MSKTFCKTLEESLAGSQIKASMDLDGNISFKRLDGGRLILQEFTSATGRQGSRTPSPGQGDKISLTGSGPVNSRVSNYSSSMQIENNEVSLAYTPIEAIADLSISALFIETQENSEKSVR